MLGKYDIAKICFGGRDACSYLKGSAYNNDVMMTDLRKKIPVDECHSWADISFEVGFEIDSIQR